MRPAAKTHKSRDAAIEHLGANGCCKLRDFASGSQIWVTPNHGEIDLLYIGDGKWMTRYRVRNFREVPR